MQLPWLLLLMTVGDGILPENAAQPYPDTWFDKLTMSGFLGRWQPKLAQPRLPPPQVLVDALHPLLHRPQ
jgi:hypothetical protein